MDIISISGQTFSLFGKLGEGRYAVVYGARDNSGERIAIKRSSVQEQEDLTACKTEIDIMKKIRHTNILECLQSEVKRHGAFYTIVMVMPFAPNGNLVSVCNKKLQNDSRLGEKTVLKMMLDTALAVSELHGQRIPVSHRDLKAENILSFPDMNFKLCDFGSTTTYSFSCATGRDMAFIEEDLDAKTTLAYRAPEQCDLMSGTLIDQRVDNWALGVVLYFLCFFDCPFQESSVAINSCQYTIPTGHPYSDELMSLIPWILTKDPNRRPSASDVAERCAEMLGNPSWGSKAKKVVGTQPRHPNLSPPKQKQQQQQPQQQAKAKPAGGLFGMLDWSDGAGEGGGNTSQGTAMPTGGGGYSGGGGAQATAVPAMNFGASGTAGMDLFAQKPQQVAPQQFQQQQQQHQQQQQQQHQQQQQQQHQQQQQQQHQQQQQQNLFPAAPAINTVTGGGDSGGLFPAVTNIDAMFSSPNAHQQPATTQPSFSPSGQSGNVSPSLDELFSSPNTSTHLNAPSHPGHNRSASDPVCGPHHQTSLPPTASSPQPPTTGFFEMFQ